MSKPGISISFGKPKASPAFSKPSSSNAPRKPAGNGFANKPPPAKRSQFTHDSDSEDEAPPKHEEVSGFDVSTGRAISSRPAKVKQELVIENSGNGDWRRRGRGKNLLPEEVRAQQEQQRSTADPATERDEVSKESGLQFAAERVEVAQQTLPVEQNETTIEQQPAREATADELALQALLSDSKGERVSNRIIEQKASDAGAVFNEVEDFRADVATRPESSTLEEYAAMPVEEFGMALLRGMGKKRRANGEVIEFGTGDPPKVREVRAGYLGIGAKGIPKGGEVELGAWGKADMRKNKQGEGLYTPVMLKDKRTGEMITEDELEARKKAAKDKGQSEDWRDRRDRNLKDRGGEDYKAQMNGFSRDSAQRRERSRSREREKDQNKPRDRGRERDRDRERESRDSSDRDSREAPRERHRDRDRDRDRERERDRGDSRRERYREEDRYDSSSSRRSGHSEREAYDERERRRDRDRDRREERHRHRDRY